MELKIIDTDTLAHTVLYFILALVCSCIPSIIGVVLLFPLCLHIISLPANNKIPIEHLLFLVVLGVGGLFFLKWAFSIFSKMIGFKNLFCFAPFRGVVVEMSMNKNFKGHTFFLDNSLATKKILIDKNKYEQVKLESVNFEKKYDVYSTDQVEARYLLTTAMMRRIEFLKFAFKAKGIRGSFKDNKLILAINTGKDMFSMGRDFEKIDFHTFANFYNEMISILKIVDQLKLYQKTGL